MSGVLRARVAGNWVDVAGGGGDVHVGTTTPTGDEELWYDTDEPAAPGGGLYVANPNNALGVVAQFPLLATALSIGATNTAISGSISFTFLVGRRYRIRCFVRAIEAAAPGHQADVSVFDGATQSAVFGLHSHNWVYANFGQAYGEWTLDGDGVTYSALHIRGLSSVSATWHVNTRPTAFYIEDMGPNSSPALPIPTTPPAWTTATTMLNGWAWYGTPYPPAQYRRIGDEVHLRGLLKNGTLNTSAFVLPVGFRPAFYQHFAVSSNAAYGGIRVDPGGDVLLAQGSNLWFDLAGVSFSVTL